MHRFAKRSSPLSNAANGPVQGMATSDAAGTFRLEIPAPGDYQIQAQREGFFLFTNQSASLDEGVPLEIHMNHLKELAESVDVHYSPPVIDPEQTSDTKRLNNQEILNIPYPASQDYRNALPLMPGAILDNAGQIHFNGGETREANYRLNGFDISDPATGGLNARLNVDTVQTLEWDASRFSPEQGKGLDRDARHQNGDGRQPLAIRRHQFYSGLRIAGRSSSQPLVAAPEVLGPDPERAAHGSTIRWTPTTRSARSRDFRSGQDRDAASASAILRGCSGISRTRRF